jgi:small subunit ribosomal protein S1
MDIHVKDESKDLEKLYAETLQRVERGSITKGKVVAIKDDGIVVDVGYKSEGIIPAADFTKEEISGLKEGDGIEVLVERINDSEGIIAVSRKKAQRIRAWEELNDLHSRNGSVEGRVIGKTKGGLLIDVMGIKAFLPLSQLDIKIIKNPEPYIGQILPLKILKVAPQKKANIFNDSVSTTPLIVSRRVILEEERDRKKEETLKVLQEGAILRGAVKNITDYGVFIDLGGIDALLHISDISWRRVNHPSEFFSVGDEKEFIVLKYDRENEKITLGYKQKKPDPWLQIDRKYSAGMKIKGKVVTITDYGVFVEIEEGLEGLVHISELDWAPRPKHPSKYVSEGDEIEALIINVNKDERRLSLSIRQLQPKPWDLVGERYKIGQKITGRIKTITDFGAFVRLPEGVDGLIHISDLSWTRHIKHPSEILKKGQKVEAMVLTLETEKERMSLGLKQLTLDPWQDEIPAKFKLGEEFKGHALRITDFGIFVELKDGVEGLVYSSEIDASKEIKEGDDIWVRVIKLNPEERKIGLSMKNLKTTMDMAKE